MSQSSLVHEWTEEQVKSAAKPNYGKLYVTAPNLLKLIGDVKNKKVLELGCGNGFWLRLLARLGAECTGIDHAQNQINAAKNWQDPYTNRISYFVGDVSDALDLHDTFDIVFLEHVLLEMLDKTTLENSVRNAAQYLKNGGKLVISDMHPFAPSSRPSNMRISDDFNYFHSGASFEIQSKRVDGETIFYKDIHWTLADISKAITDAGLKITDIIEPLPTEEMVKKYQEELSYRLIHPMAIMIKAEK